MIINIRLGTVDLEDAESAFNDTASESLRQYLYTDCVLDKAGVDRVMILLQAVFMRSYRQTVLTGNFPMNEDGSDQPAAGATEVLRSCVDAVALPASRAINRAQMEVMYSTATVLSHLDQRMHKRTLQ